MLEGPNPQDPWRGRCVVCLEPAACYHHFEYKSAGGADEIANYVPLCIKDHARRHEGELTDEFLEMRSNIVKGIYND